MGYDKRLLVGKTALIVEDHPTYAENTAGSLQALGLEVHVTCSLLGALTLVSTVNEIDLALVDIYLPLEDGGIDRQNMGIYLSAILKGIWIDVPIIAISNYIEEIPETFTYLFADVLKKRDVFMQRNGIQTLIDAAYSSLVSSNLRGA